MKVNTGGVGRYDVLSSGRSVLRETETDITVIGYQQKTLRGRK